MKIHKQARLLALGGLCCLWPIQTHGANYSSTVLNDQPAAYWRLGESEGETVADAKGAHPGRYIAGVALGVPGVLSGDADTAAGFDEEAQATGAYVQVPYSPDFHSPAFSVEAWAKPTAGQGKWRAVVASTNFDPSKVGSDRNSGYLIYAGLDDRPGGGPDRWQFWCGRGWGRAWGTEVVLGEWVHLVGTYDGTTERFYVNGQLQDSVDNPMIINESRPLRIGAGATHIDTADAFFYGDIDEVAIYNTALSEAQVQAHYLAAKPRYTDEVAADQPVAHWRLGEAEGNTAADAKGTHPGQYRQSVTLGVPGALIWDANTAAGFDEEDQNTGSHVEVPYAAALNPPLFTIEAWAKVTGGAGTWRTVVCSRNFVPSEPVGAQRTKGYLIYAGQDNHWQFWCGLSWNTILGPQIVPDEWTHLVGTYDGTTERFYVNGELAGSAATTLLLNESRPFRIGAGSTEVDTAENFFKGIIDEVAVYNTALSEARVKAHYAAAGKAVGPSPPRILTQPQSQIAFAGESVTFSIVATNNPTYQWQRNGSSIPGATNSTLVVSNVSLANAGTYTVILTNEGGIVESAAATLILLPPPAPGQLFLSDVEPLQVHVLAGVLPDDKEPVRDRGRLGNPLMLDGQVYKKGLMMHVAGDGFAEAVYDVLGFKMFSAVLGIDENNGGAGSVEFIISVDDGQGGWVEKYRSGAIFPEDPAIRVTIDIGGATYLKLYATDAGDGIGGDHATWANANITRDVFLSDIEPLSAHVLAGVMPDDKEPVRDRGREGKPLVLNGVLYSKGLMMHVAGDNYAEAIYNVGGYKTFSADLGLDENNGGGASEASVVFVVYTGTTGNWVEKFRSGVVRGTTPTIPLVIDLAGAAQLRLYVTDAGDGISGDHATWGNARIVPSGAIPPPIITSQPKSQTVFVGADVTLTVAALGNPTYQWQFNGADIAGATKAALALKNVQPSAAGTYRVVITSAGGSVTSEEAILAVAVPPPSVYISEMDLISSHVLSSIFPGVIGPERNRGREGKPLVLNGVQYGKGIMMHVAPDGYAEAVYNVSGYTTFRADIGIDENNGAQDRGSVVFVVLTRSEGGEWVEKYRSEVIRGTSPTVALQVDISGASELKLYATDGGDGIDADHATWADARVTKEIYLSSLEPLRVHVLAGIMPDDKEPVRDRGREGKPLVLNGITYAKGIMMHVAPDGYAEAIYDVSAYTTFAADLGLDENNGGGGSDASVVFVVYTGTPGNWVEKYRSEIVRSTTPTIPLVIDLANAPQLRLYVTDAGDGIGGDHATWANARLFPRPAVPLPVITSQPVSQNALLGATVALAIGATGDPTYQWQFNGQDIAGATQATLVLRDVQSANAGAYRVVVSNAAGSVVSQEAIVRVATGPGIVFISGLEPSSVHILAGILPDDKEPVRDRGREGKPLVLNGVQYAKGIMMHVATDGYAEAIYNVSGYNRFLADIGLDENNGGGGGDSSVTFTVFIRSDPNGAWTKKYESGVLRDPDPTLHLEIDISGASQLRLYNTDAGDGIGGDHATWAQAGLLPGVPPLDPDIETQPQSQTATTGSTVNFSVLTTAKSTLPISYQWQKNRLIDIPGATDSTLTLRK
jgi:hypothetical protein